MGAEPAKPLLFHYIIGTRGVKRRSHADNIIVSLYGRRERRRHGAPREKDDRIRKKKKKKRGNCVDTLHVCTFAKARTCSQVITVRQQPRGGAFERVKQHLRGCAHFPENISRHRNVTRYSNKLISSSECRYDKIKKQARRDAAAASHSGGSQSQVV